MATTLTIDDVDSIIVSKTKKLCGANATLTEIWQAVATAQAPKQTATFSTLSAEFQQTRIWQKLSPSTQKDYIDCHNAITRALAFWDYSVDNRSGSNSAFFAPSLEISAEELIRQAALRFPEIWQRLPPITILAVGAEKN